MFDSKRWDALVAGDACPLCLKLASDDSPENETPMAVVGSGTVYLQKDGDFPGYCILVCRKHCTELYQLDEVERSQFIEDISAIAEAISSACSPAKINYAILGNEVPHLHAHIIPRYPTDGYWGRPIWARNADQKTASAEADYEQLLEKLRLALASRVADEEDIEDAEDAAYFDTRR